jgi:DNA recombination protein RmuC
VTVLFIIALVAFLASLVFAFREARSAAESRGYAEELRKQMTGSQLRAAELEATLIAERKSIEDRLALQQSTQRHLEQSFRALAAEALQNNSQMLLDRSREQIESVVAPVRDTLTRFDQNVQKLEVSRAEAYGSLTQQIQHLMQSQGQLRDSADQLKNALRAPQHRGRWGEIQLRRVVELAGMIAHCDFHEQQTLFGDRNIRPDVIIHLPNGRDIVVDAKVSLDAYLRAIETPDEARRDALLTDHARQVRTHVKSLGEKSYWERLPGSPDFVVAFLPLESIYSAALQKDGELLNFGVDRRVLLATPTTLIALLYAVAHGWRERDFTENAERIREVGKELYERVVNMHGHVAKLGRELGGAVSAYNSAVGSLESRVLVSARKFRDLQQSPSREMEVLDTVDAAPRKLSAGDWPREKLADE